MVRVRGKLLTLIVREMIRGKLLTLIVREMIRVRGKLLTLIVREMIRGKLLALIVREMVRVMMFNTIFYNISVISRRPVLLVGDTGENH